MDDPLFFMIDTVYEKHTPMAVKGHTEDQTIFCILHDDIDGDYHWNIIKVRTEYIEMALKGDISIRDLYDHRMGYIWIGTFKPKNEEVGKAVSLADPEYILYLLSSQETYFKTT